MLASAYCFSGRARYVPRITSPHDALPPALDLAALPGVAIWQMFLTSPAVGLGAYNICMSVLLGAIEAPYLCSCMSEYRNNPPPLPGLAGR